MCSRNGSELGPFLDHYLLLRVNGESVFETVPIKNG